MEAIFFINSSKPLGISYVYLLQFVLLKKQKQSLLVTQFCKLVHIKIKNFNSISFEQLFELIILLNWAMSYTHLSKKKKFDEKDRCPLVNKPDWAKLDRVLSMCHNPIWRNIRRVWVETRTSESVDWCDYWSYTLKLEKQISPLLGMMIITETRTPENGIGKFCC